MTDRRRTVVVTGASSGIGKTAAKALAIQGWYVIGIGRNPHRSASVASEIRAAAGDNAIDMIVADLSLMAEVMRASREISALTDSIHVLINNAGGMAKEKVITAEGLEENFAGNHLGPFLLTLNLIPLLKYAASDVSEGSVRVINTSSDASEMIQEFPFDDLQNIDNYSNGAAYCHSKLANVLHARALAKRLAGDDIVAHSFHPGTPDTNFSARVDERTKAYIDTLDKITPEEGADTLLWLATSEEAGKTTGGYWYQREPRAPNPLVDDAAAVDRLWTESKKLVATVNV